MDDGYQRFVVGAATRARVLDRDYHRKQPDVVEDLNINQFLRDVILTTLHGIAPSRSTPMVELNGVRDAAGRIARS